MSLTEEQNLRKHEETCIFCEASYAQSEGLIFDDGAFICFSCQGHLDIIAPGEIVEPVAAPGPDLDTCGSCRTFMPASNGEDSGEGFYCYKCREEADKTGVRLSPTLICDKCGSFVKTGGDWKDMNTFCCSDCLELARKREQLTEAIAIVQAAVIEAYPHRETTVSFYNTGYMQREEADLDSGDLGAVGGYGAPQYLAAELLARIKTNKE